jgi:hypothetical protein
MSGTGTTQVGGTRDHQGRAGRHRALVANLGLLGYRAAA